MTKRKSPYTPPWKPFPPSLTCESLVGDVPCGLPSVYAYPAMGGGYHAMCDAHAQKHLSICVTIEAAKRGETPFMPAAPPAPTGDENA